jgi:hypothetical protein
MGGEHNLLPMEITRGYINNHPSKNIVVKFIQTYKVDDKLFKEDENLSKWINLSTHSMWSVWCSSKL